VFSSKYLVSIITLQKIKSDGGITWELLFDLLDANKGHKNEVFLFLDQFWTGYFPVFFQEVFHQAGTKP
jgi:hypothetical protein